jgi:hypothetical protein
VNRKLLLLLLASLLTTAGIGEARASVLVNENQVVRGTMATSTALSLSGAGELSVTLTDMGNSTFPAPFASLQFALSDATSTLTDLSGAGTLMLDLTAPKTVYVDVFATSQGSIGLYNLTASFGPASAVPLPGSVVCLAGGCFAMFLLWRCAGRLVPQQSVRFAQATVTSSVA